MTNNIKLLTAQQYANGDVSVYEFGTTEIRIGMEHNQYYVKAFEDGLRVSFRYNIEPNTKKAVMRKVSELHNEYKMELQLQGLKARPEWYVEKAERSLHDTAFTATKVIKIDMEEEKVLVQYIMSGELREDGRRAVMYATKPRWFKLYQNYNEREPGNVGFYFIFLGRRFYLDNMLLDMRY